MPGYHVVSRFKTFDRYGNPHLTLQRRGNSGDDYAAGVDLDDAQGFEHIFQVLRNAASGAINPCAIHDIALAYAAGEPWLRLCVRGHRVSVRPPQFDTGVIRTVPAARGQYICYFV